MTYPRQMGQGTEQRVGTRPYEDVERAYRRREAAAPGAGRPQFAAGAITAYRWALGQQTRAPVTGAAGGAVPSLPALTAEVDAALVQLEDTTLRGGPREYTEGAHDALAWVCGYSEARP